MTNNQPTPDQTGTWEPDWDAVQWTIDEFEGSHPYPIDTMVLAKSVVESYRRQQAEHGVVEVRRVDIFGVRDKIAFLADWVAINDAPDIDNELRSFVRGLDFALDPGPFAGLAAAQEQRKP